MCTTCFESSFGFNLTISKYHLKICWFVHAKLLFLCHATSTALWTLKRRLRTSKATLKLGFSAEKKSDVWRFRLANDSKMNLFSRLMSMSLCYFSICFFVHNFKSRPWTNRHNPTRVGFPRQKLESMKSWGSNIYVKTVQQIMTSRWIVGSLV